MSKTMPTKLMKLIVAMDIDCGIGKSGTIPWSLRKDMAYFLEHTTAVNDKSKVIALPHYVILFSLIHFMF